MARNLYYVRVMLNQNVINEFIADANGALGAMSDNASVAMDAVMANHPDAARIVIGLDCTVSLMANESPAKVIKASASLKTVTVEYTAEPCNGGLAGKQLTFRLTKYGYTASRGHYRLTFGTATHNYDPM